MTDEQAQIVSAYEMSLEEEQKRKILLSEDKIWVEAQERSHNDKVEKVKSLEDQFKKMGDLH